MPPRFLLLLIPCLFGLLGCRPALDWREVAVPEAELLAMFPCKPQRWSDANQGMLHCEAGGQRFVLAWQRATAPQVLQAGLAAAAADAASRAGAGAGVEPLVGAKLPSGALDWPGSGRFRLRGAEQPAQLLFWARGLTSYRALVVGSRADEVGAPFFDGLRTAP